MLLNTPVDFVKRFNREFRVADSVLPFVDRKPYAGDRRIPCGVDNHPPIFDSRLARQVIVNRDNFLSSGGYATNSAFHENR
jgi:hypothetical protein